VRQFAAAVTLLGAFFATAAVPSPLLEFLQQRWGFPTGLLTFAFGVYALSLLATLFLAGSLSDRVGRRPVLLAACLLQAAVCIVFLTAGSVWVIVGARVLQGVATGLASSCLSAVVTETAPAGRERLAAAASGSAPLAGLTAGAVAAGLAEEWTSWPVAYVFAPLLAVFAGAALLSRVMPETAFRRAAPTAPGRWHLLAGIRASVRREFVTGIPTAVATWSLGGLYLALAPAIVQHAFGLNGTSIGGIAIGLLTGAGAVVPVAVRAVPARTVAIAANLAMLTGVAAALAAVAVHSIALFLLASLVSGTGFGAGFSSWIRLLMPGAAPAERARLYTAFYLVNYLAFGLPALVAGEVIGLAGLKPTVLAYGVLTMTAAAAGLRNEISQTRSQRSARHQAQPAPALGAMQDATRADYCHRRRLRYRARSREALRAPGR
jgi:MFS family permease